MKKNISQLLLIVGISLMLTTNLTTAEEWGHGWEYPEDKNKNDMNRQISPSHASGQYRTMIPKDIESMWVFYQKANVQSMEGCTIGGDAISPTEFTQKIDEFVAYASKNNVNLIITAYSPTRGWVGAANEIRINGSSLKPTRPYWCNGKRNYGYELELH